MMGFMPSSNARRAAKSPAGPAPTMTIGRLVELVALVILVVLAILVILVILVILAALSPFLSSTQWYITARRRQSMLRLTTLHSPPRSPVALAMARLIAASEWYSSGVTSTCICFRLIVFSMFVAVGSNYKNTKKNVKNNYLYIKYLFFMYLCTRDEK
jgi:CDP-diglyceride synthetase